MARVLPAQIVSLIDKMYPNVVERPTGENTMDNSHLPALAALVQAIDEVPPELVVLAPNVNLGFIAGLATVADIFVTGDQAFTRQLKRIPMECFKVVVTCSTFPSSPGFADARPASTSPLTNAPAELFTTHGVGREVFGYRSGLLCDAISELLQARVLDLAVDRHRAAARWARAPARPAR
jgi:hypothetical protein